MCHNFEPDWVATRPINILFDLYETHLKTRSMNPVMGGAIPQNVTEDKYSTKTWKEGNKVMNRVNILEGGNVPAREGLMRGKGNAK